MRTNSEKANVKRMLKVESIVESFEDLYASPTSERITELELMLAELEWDGLYLAAPDSVESTASGIPILALSGFTSLREWEVEPRKNSTMLLADLDGGTVHFSSLFKRPVKAMKQVPKSSRPSPESNGRRYGCVRNLVGESLPNGLPAGTYAVAHISWDRLSNIRQVVKKNGLEMGAKPQSVNPTAPVLWPWKRWAESQAFKAAPNSPEIGAGESLALKAESGGNILMGAVSIKARPIHVISPETAGRTVLSVHAGVNVDLLLFALDRPFPEVVRVVVPIHSTSPIGVGDFMQGWFSVPFPFEPSAADRMLYAVADGEISGPVRIPGKKM